MTEQTRFIRATKKCLSDAHRLFAETMEILDDMGRADLGVGMTPLIGGYGMQDPNKKYREALIKLDQAERSLEPLSRRIKDGTIKESHFKNRETMTLLIDITGCDYQILIRYLAERKNRESVWYRLKELNKKIERVLDILADE